MGRHWGKLGDTCEQVPLYNPAKGWPPSFLSVDCRRFPRSLAEIHRIQHAAGSWTSWRDLAVYEDSRDRVAAIRSGGLKRGPESIFTPTSPKVPGARFTSSSPRTWANPIPWSRAARGAAHSSSCSRGRLSTQPAMGVSPGGLESIRMVGFTITCGPHLPRRRRFLITDRAIRTASSARRGFPQGRTIDT